MDTTTESTRLPYAGMGSTLDPYGAQEKEDEEIKLESIVEIVVGSLLALISLTLLAVLVVRKSNCLASWCRCRTSDELLAEKLTWKQNSKQYDTMERGSCRIKEPKSSPSFVFPRIASLGLLLPVRKSKSDGNGNVLSLSPSQLGGQRSPGITRSLDHGSIPFTLPPTGLGKSHSQDSSTVERVQPMVPFSSSVSDTFSPPDTPFSTDGAFFGDGNRNSFDNAFNPFNENSETSPKNKLKSTGQFRNSLIGQIQPELYKYSENEDHDLPPSQYGRIWFSLVYDAAVEALSVTVIKVRQLSGRRSNVPHDCFVKLFLLPDERMSQQTKVQRRTNNPRFNETFLFQVSETDIRERTLRLSVYDVDKRKVARHLLGHALVTLSDVDLLSQGENVMWRDLDERAHPGDSGASLGELNISLSYLPTMDRLTVVVLRARNLREIDLESTGVYVKVSLTQGHQVIKTRKTAMKRGVCDPQYHESFSFTVTSKEIESSCLSINVVTLGFHTGIRQLTASLKNIVSTGKPTNEHKYGRVVVGSFMFCRGEQLLHWQEMLAQPRKSIVKWHPLSEVTPMV